jgi:hypothetical protein
LRKQIAGALVVSLLIGSAPGWAADGENAKSTPTVEVGEQRQQFRDSIDRVALTAGERADLETRRAALRTDPVARGTGGILLGLVATAASIGLTMYLLKKTDESTTIPSMGRH